MLTPSEHVATASPPPPKRTDRQVKRQRAAELRRQAKRAAELRQEALDEAIAPAIQRKDVLSPDGIVVRAARVVKDGNTFIRSSPLARMADAGTLRADHIAAARRLTITWDIVGGGIGLGASDWGSVRSGRGTPTEPAGHAALVSQVEHRRELEYVHSWLGAHAWGCLASIALDGMSPTAWAARAGLHHTVAAGYLLACLDRLVAFYTGADQVPERKGPIRAVVVG